MPTRLGPSASATELRNRCRKVRILSGRVVGRSWDIVGDQYPPSAASRSRSRMGIGLREVSTCSGVLPRKAGAGSSIHARAWRAPNSRTAICRASARASTIRPSALLGSGPGPAVSHRWTVARLLPMARANCSCDTPNHRRSGRTRIRRGLASTCVFVRTATAGAPPQVLYQMMHRLASPAAITATTARPRQLSPKPVTRLRPA
jgi:hypothetical protein